MADAKKGNMDLRVTSLVGAGAVLEIGGLGMDHHSTAAITKAIFEPQYNHGLAEYYYTERIELTKAIFNRLLEEYNRRNPEDPISATKALTRFHFEVIYHIIESLYSYDYFWSETSKNEADRPPIVDFIQPILGFSWIKLMKAHHSFITTVMEIVNEYDWNFRENIINPENRWYKNWWSNAPFIWDVFNLNYDTTIEYSLNEYTDGYTPLDKYDFSCFSQEVLLKEKYKHTINHLHGCILYGLAKFWSRDKVPEVMKYSHRDLVKYPTYERSSSEWLSLGYGDNKTFQSKEKEVYAPIITGLRKTDKLLHLPLDVYRWNLERKIMENNALVIVGYSFGDTYVNDVINRMRLYHGDKMRVVLIDHKLSASPSEVESGRYDRQAALGRALCTSFPQAGWEMILRAMHVGDYNECQFSQYKTDMPIISENGQLMCCYQGFRDAVENHAEEIYNFVQS